MDWITKMNAAIEYIEQNLREEIDQDEISKIANCSSYHFQRVFTYVAGTTLAEYIRRRRLTLAAFDLQSSDEKVIDIALKYGYDSPTAFTRAFQNLHKMTPTEAKIGNKIFTAYPPISFQITIKGVSAMNYRVITKEAFRVVGIKLETTMENDECYQAIPKFWMDNHQNGMCSKIGGFVNQEPFGLLGISSGDWHKQMQLDYYIAASSNEPLAEGMIEYTVPASQWAVFECVGPIPGALQELQKRVVSEWLPTSGYDYGSAPDIEVYTDGDNQAPDYKCYVWLPIVKKL